MSEFRETPGIDDREAEYLPAPPPLPPRGRGAAGNPANRFETIAYEPDLDLSPEERPAPATIFLRDASRSIIATNDSPDVSFDASINPYRGCEHGCSYCFARPTHEYLGFSAGLDFETRIMVKEHAPELLARQLDAPKWKPQVLIMSGVTDPYQPIERRLQLTRRCLEVLDRYSNPVAIITKNRLVARDADVLGRMAARGLASVSISLTTLDAGLAREMEPRTSAPEARLEAMRALAEAGVPVTAMLAPIVPGLTDHEIPRLIEAAAKAGARRAGYVILRLPHAVAPLFEAWLEARRPGEAKKVLSRVRSMRGGKLYDAAWGKRLRGEGVHAQQIERLFDVALRRHGLDRDYPPLRTDLFRRPGAEQLELFG